MSTLTHVGHIPECCGVSSVTGAIHCRLPELQAAGAMGGSMFCTPLSSERARLRRCTRSSTCNRSFPRRLPSRSTVCEFSVNQSLHLTDLPTLARLGVDVEHYQSRDYAKTQEIADAAYFLGFDGLFVPSARWHCTNAVHFTDRIEPARLSIDITEAKPVDWRSWRRRTRSSDRPRG